MEKIEWKQGLSEEELGKYTINSIILAETARNTHTGRKRSAETRNRISKGQKARYTDEQLKHIAAKYKSRHEFQKRNTSAYNVSWKRGKKFFNSICEHMKEGKRIYKTYTIEELHKRAKKFKSRAEFSKLDNAAYVKACRMNVLDDVCKHMKKSSKWNEKNLKQLIKNKKINTKRQFRIEEPNACRAAYSMKLLDKLFPKK